MLMLLTEAINLSRLAKTMIPSFIWLRNTLKRVFRTSQMLPHICECCLGFGHPCTLVRKDGNWYPIEWAWVQALCSIFTYHWQDLGLATMTQSFPPGFFRPCFRCKLLTTVSSSCSSASVRNGVQELKAGMLGTLTNSLLRVFIPLFTPSFPSTYLLVLPFLSEKDFRF